jgi:hypothetical protein
VAGALVRARVISMLEARSEEIGGDRSGSGLKRREGIIIIILVRNQNDLASGHF